MTKVVLMADEKVGLEIARWLLTEFSEDVGLIVVTSENEIGKAARVANVPYAIFESSGQICGLTDELGIVCDLGILAWWPTIIDTVLINKPRMGFINTHPSLLPYNRGKHYNFWALVEQAPFGVSLHMVEKDVDSGAVISQRPIHYTWEDNGGSLYHIAQREMVALFQNSYPTIRKLEFERTPQDLTSGSFHIAAELKAASEIDLDRSYPARDLLNLLRARTFAGHPACWFRDGEEKFEVRVEIQKKDT